MVCIVLHLPGRLRDNQKRYRFTPSVSNWRMPEAISVDALCGFGAKNLIRCTEFIQPRVAWSVNGPRFIGHSAIFYTACGSVMVRSREKCLMSERLRCDLSAKARVEVCSS